MFNMLFVLTIYLVLKIKINILSFDFGQIEHNWWFQTYKLDSIIILVAMLIVKKSCFVIVWCASLSQSVAINLNMRMGSKFDVVVMVA